MGLLDPRKTGLSNGIAQQEGYPTSGETSANAGRLPAQRSQQPFEHKRAQTNIPEPTTRPLVGGGTLNGGAVQGSQYKTSTVPMSPSVASFVAIPTVTTKFAQPGGPSLPGSTPIVMNNQGGASFFGGGSGQQGFSPTPPSQSEGQSQQKIQPTPAQAGGQQQKILPMQNGPYSPSEPVDYMSGFGLNQFGKYANFRPQSSAGTAPAPASEQAPAPTTGSEGYNYQQEMQKMGQQYDAGGAWDLAQRRLLDEKIRQQNMMMAAQSRLAGRGGNIADVSQNYANQLALLGHEAERAQLEQGARQQWFSNQMAYANAVNDAKVKMIALAKDLGLNVDDLDFNKAAADVINQYGPNITSGQFLEVIKDKLSGKVSELEKQADAYASSLRSLWNGANTEQNLVSQISMMDKNVLKKLAEKHPSLVEDILDEVWFGDWDKVVAAFEGAGVNMSQYK